MKPGTRVIVRATGLRGEVVALHELGVVVATHGNTTIYSASELVRVPGEAELEASGQQSMFGAQ